MNETPTCLMCDGAIFVADPDFAGATVWAHVDDNGCDDPVPGSIPDRPVTDEDWANLPILSLDNFDGFR